MLFMMPPRRESRGPPTLIYSALASSLEASASVRTAALSLRGRGSEVKRRFLVEEKVIASWKYKKGALDAKTAFLCYLAANLAAGNTH